MEITTAEQEIANDDYDLMIRMASKLLTDFWMMFFTTCC